MTKIRLHSVSDELTAGGVAQERFIESPSECPVRTRGLGQQEVDHGMV